MPILLLGATGNIGSRLLPALLAHRQKVVVYVRNEKKLEELISAAILSQVTIVKGDATDSSSITDTLLKHGCDTVINSAGLASVLPWSKPQMQEIIEAVATGAVDASKKLNRPIRAWFLGGMSVLEFPDMKGTQLMSYFPLFTEHNLTYRYLSNSPQQNLRWSMICPRFVLPQPIISLFKMIESAGTLSRDSRAPPQDRESDLENYNSQMIPASKDVTLLDAPRGNSLNAAADVAPAFKNSIFHNIPYLGPFISLVGNFPKYGVALEDVADFIAADLEKGDTTFVGHRVGIIDAGKGKVE